MFKVNNKDIRTTIVVGCLNRKKIKIKIKIIHPKFGRVAWIQLCLNTLRKHLIDLAIATYY